MCFVALLLGKYSECEGMKVFHVFTKHPKNKLILISSGQVGTSDFIDFLKFTI